MSQRFVHLHLHSEYSLQDSTVRLKPLIEQVRERGMGAVSGCGIRSASSR